AGQGFQDHKSEPSSRLRERPELVLALARGVQHRLPGHGAVTGIEPDHDVLEDGHVLEQPDSLEGAADPARDDQVRTQADYGAAGGKDPRAVGSLDAGAAVEARRPASAI